jgi:hypothetical protein
VSPENQKKADARAKEILDDVLRQETKRRERDDWDQYVLDYHLRASKALIGLSETPLGAYGFIPMFSAYITGTWTAIEAMFGDLWEAALNTHPKKLATLNGKPRRDANKPKQTNQSVELEKKSDADKKFDLNLVAKHEFDLRLCMGTIFVQRGDLNSLASPVPERLI